MGSKRKVERSGLRQAFDGHVLIYIHKEEELADIERLYPANRYVMIDDKLRILDSTKQIWGDRLTTISPSKATTRPTRGFWPSTRMATFNWTILATSSDTG
jgi:hypothetical protein